MILFHFRTAAAFILALMQAVIASKNCISSLFRYKKKKTR